MHTHFAPFARSTHELSDKCRLRAAKRTVNTLECQNVFLPFPDRYKVASKNELPYSNLRFGFSKPLPNTSFHTATFLLYNPFPLISNPVSSPQSCLGGVSQAFSSLSHPHPFYYPFLGSVFHLNPATVFTTRLFFTSPTHGEPNFFPSVSLQKSTTGVFVFILNHIPFPAHFEPDSLPQSGNRTVDMALQR